MEKSTEELVNDIKKSKDIFAFVEENRENLKTENR